MKRKTAFEKIAEGLTEALAIARGDSKPAKLYIPPEISQLCLNTANFRSRVTTISD